MRERLQTVTTFIQNCWPARIGFFLILGTLFLQTSSQATAQTLNIQTYNNEDGLAQSQVQTIIQDSEGYLWFGTVDGLSRFNGTSFVNFTVKDGMASNEVTACALIHDGNIWFGHSDGKISIYSPRTHRFSKFESGRALGKGLITFIFEDGRHQIWIGTYDDGLYKYHQQKLAHFSMKNGLPYNGIFSICQPDSNTLYLGTENGLIQIPAQADFNQIQPKALFKGNKKLLDNIESLLLDSRGHLWIGTISNGLFEYIPSVRNPNQWTFRHYSIHNGLPSEWVEALFEDQDQNILVGTFSGGVVKLTPVRRARSVKYRFFYIDKNHGLPNNYVNAIYQDSEGNYWFGTDGEGVAQFRDSSFMLFTQKDGLPGNSIWSIAQSNNGCFWIGTENGLATCDINSQFSRILSFKVFTKKDGLTENYIQNIFVDSTGMLWLATNENGVTRFDPTTYQTWKFTVRNGFPSNEINCIQSDKNNHLWFGTYSEGAFVYLAKQKKYKFFTKEDGLGGDQINQILRDHSGRLWFATNGGLTKFDGSSFKNFGPKDGLSNCNIISLAEDSSNHIWAGSSGGGVFIFDGTHFKNYTTRNGLSGDFIYSITVDGRKSVWIGTSRGVDRFNSKDSTLTHFGRREGFLGIECNQGAGFRDKYGTLWFGTIKGLVHFNPKMAKPNTHPPGIKITNVELFYKNIPFTQNLKLKHGQNHLTFHFEAISFTRPSLINYRFRLEGFDKDWSPLTRQTEAIYPKLPPGHYVFQVRARNSNGIWSTNAAKLAFRIVPPFWLTGWFIFLVLFAGSAGAFSVYRIRENRIRTNRQMLERKVQERTRELNQEKERLQLALQALAESEEKFRTLAESTPSAIFIYREKFLYVNPAMEKITKYTSEELLSLNFWEIVHADFREQVKSRGLLRIGETGDARELPVRYEFKILTKTGEERWVDFTAKTIVLNGQKAGLGTAIDITDRKRAEETVRHREAQLRTLINAMPDIVCFKDGQGRWLEANEFDLRLFQIENVPYRGKKDSELAPYSPFYKEAFLTCERTDELAWEKGEISRGDEVIPQPDGSTKIFDVIKVPIFNEDSSRQGLVVIGRDITERKRMEDALRKEKEQLSTTLQSITDGVISATPDGKVLLMNRVAEKLTGWSYSLAQNKLISDIFNILDENTGKPCEYPIKRMEASHDSAEWMEPCVLLSKDGTEHLIALSVAPIRGEKEKIRGVIVAFRDITEKRRMEQELIKAEKLESLGLLAGGIAHDFNNILTGIMGNISLAKMEIDPDKELFEILTEAENASLRAKDLTRQLLTFSKGGAPIRKATSIRDLIRDTARFALRGSNISFEFHSSRDLWPADVDEGQISQVLNNLIINAKHAMPSGGTIWISVENIVVEESMNLPVTDGRYVKISIKDEGMGIPKEHLTKIFDPYFTTKQQGSGLGLASVYSIIKRHNGYIGVESELGKGTKFTLYLPTAEKLPEEGVAKIERSERGRGRILVMDDEKVIREVISRMLGRLGYEPHVTKNGEEALEVYQDALEKNELFDLVILDLTIPGGMGGKETLQELRKLNPDVVAIVSSGYSTDAVMAEYRSFGFAGLVTKPFNMRELGETVQKILENNKYS